jgi:hypothetical protein
VEEVNMSKSASPEQQDLKQSFQESLPNQSKLHSQAHISHQTTPLVSIREQHKSQIQDEVVPKEEEEAPVEEEDDVPYEEEEYEEDA